MPLCCVVGEEENVDIRVEEDDTTMPPKEKAPAPKKSTTSVAEKPDPSVSIASKPPPKAEWFGLNISNTDAITQVYKDNHSRSYKVDLLFFVTGVPEKEEHPTILIVGPQTIHVVWKFDKVFFGPLLPAAVSDALNFSTESARYAAYDSIGQAVSSSLVAKSTSGKYLPSPPQIVNLPMRILKNQPIIRHLSYPTGVMYNIKHKQFDTLFIVTLTVDQEWQDLNAESRQGKTLDFGLGETPSPSPMKGARGGDGGGRGMKRSKSLSEEMEEEGKLKEEEDPYDKNL